MDKSADKIIQTLEPEIEAKCRQLRQKRKERAALRIFILGLIAALIVPALLIFAGATWFAVLTPFAFLAAGFIVLSPILINMGGSVCE